MRILLHPGFHKTGTSSLQAGAEAQRAALADKLHYMNTADLKQSSRAARRFSARPERFNLTRFAWALEADLAALHLSGPDRLLISSEDLCGSLPGLRGVMSYHAVPSLMNVAAATLRSHFGTGAALTIWFTTRQPESWLRSMWYQNLRAQRLTETYEAFRPLLAPAARLDAVVAQVSARVGPGVHVAASRIEKSNTDPLGPLGSALDLLELSRTGLPAMVDKNVQPPGAAEELLALNLSDLSNEELARAKRDTIRRYRKIGKTRRAQT